MCVQGIMFQGIWGTENPPEIFDVLRLADQHGVNINAFCIAVE
jgi:hypothetical protein